MRWCRTRLTRLNVRVGLRSRLHYSTSASPASRIRNIGIVAHIDAGKTTTTERMLYYSGFTHRLGAVDHGSTVTDFLPAEQARGITIQSAAVTFTWPVPSDKQRAPLLSSEPHSINLIDTPGHADFTFEVLRALRVLDGVVCVLDGVAGVEAQTEHVWAQAGTYQIPGVFYINKLDRDGASFADSVRSIAANLSIWPAVCQIPWWTKHGSALKLRGLGDVVNLRAIEYNESNFGRDYNTIELDALRTQDPAFAQTLQQARCALVELLSEHDDTMVELFMDCNDDHLAIPAEELLKSLRKVTLASPQRVAAVFAGSSLKNIGVQPLLDAVVNFLPSPQERPDAEARLGQSNISLEVLLNGNTSLSDVLGEATSVAKQRSSSKALVDFKSLVACALAFKVVNDPKRGVLVYVRVYSGAIKRSVSLYNTNLGLNEKTQRIFRMQANDAQDVDEIAAGEIGVLPGLKWTRTGDTLVVYTGSNPTIAPPFPINTLQLRPIDVPPPVFFASVEPHSLGEQKHVEDTLQILLREDPSLEVKHDAESGQTHLAGMGEMHLEIAGDRLINDLKAKARLGAIQVGYRETVTLSTGPQHYLLDRVLAGKPAQAGCTSAVGPSTDINVEGGDTTTLSDGNSFSLTMLTSAVETSSKAPNNSPYGHLSKQVVHRAVRNGVAAALSYGPSHGFQMHSVHVTLSIHSTTDLTPSTTPAALATAVRHAVRQSLRTSTKATDGTMLMEPIMNVTIFVNESSIGEVSSDISSARDGQIVSLNTDADPSTTESASIIDPARVYAPRDPFAVDTSATAADSWSSPRLRQIEARVPLRKMVGYMAHLRSLTKGRCGFRMSVDTFERMGQHRMKAVLASLYG